MATKTNLLGMTRAQLEAFFAALGEKPYRAVQAMKWIYRAGATDFAAMTDISKSLRQELARIAEIRAPELHSGRRAGDGVVKWLTRARSGQSVETVLIPDISTSGARRNTLCISSQVGCVLDCRFCATGKQGFSGNLDRSEIVGQVWQAARHLPPGESVTNIVFMGMGEPLLNFDAVTDAIDVFLDDLAFGISKRRVTVSTAGVVPRIDELAARTDVSLAVSLHAANDELRSRLVPLNRRYPIAELLAACRRYLRVLGARRSITMEYTLIQGVNDNLEDADELVDLLADLRCKINLIAFNPFPETPLGVDGARFERPSRNRVMRFQQRLIERGAMALLRTTRGDDVAAACGQLTGSFEDRTRRKQRYFGNSHGDSQSIIHRQPATGEAA